MCCPCAIQIRRFGQSYGLFLTTQGPESRRMWVSFEGFATFQCIQACQAFRTAFFGISVGIHMIISGNYRQNAREFGTDITRNDRKFPRNI